MTCNGPPELCRARFLAQFISACLFCFLSFHTGYWIYVFYLRRNDFGFEARRMTITLISSAAIWLYQWSCLLDTWSWAYDQPPKDQSDEGLLGRLIYYLCLSAQTTTALTAMLFLSVRFWLIFFDASLAVANHDNEWISLITQPVTFRPKVVACVTFKSEPSPPPAQSDPSPAPSADNSGVSSSLPADKSGAVRTSTRMSPALTIHMLRNIKEETNKDVSSNSHRRWSHFSVHSNATGGIGDDSTAMLSTEQLLKEDYGDIIVDDGTDEMNGGNAFTKLITWDNEGMKAARLSIASRNSRGSRNSRSSQRNSQRSSRKSSHHTLFSKAQSTFRDEMSTVIFTRPANWFYLNKFTYGNLRWIENRLWIVLPLIWFCGLIWLVFEQHWFILATRIAYMLFNFLFIVFISSIFSHYPNYRDSLRIRRELQLVRYTLWLLLLEIVIYLILSMIHSLNDRSENNKQSNRIDDYHSFWFNFLWNWIWILSMTILSLIQTKWVCLSFPKLTKRQRFKGKSTLDIGLIEGLFYLECVCLPPSFDDEVMAALQKTKSNSRLDVSTSGVVSPTTSWISPTYSITSYVKKGMASSLRLLNEQSRKTNTQTVRSNSPLPYDRDLKLREVLRDEMGFRAFITHLFSEFSYEGLLCIIELSQFSECLRVEESAAERLELQKRSSEVNIDRVFNGLSQTALVNRDEPSSVKQSSPIPIPMKNQKSNTSGARLTLSGLPGSHQSSRPPLSLPSSHGGTSLPLLHVHESPTFVPLTPVQKPPSNWHLLSHLNSKSTDTTRHSVTYTASSSYGSHGTPKKELIVEFPDMVNRVASSIAWHPKLTKEQKFLVLYSKYLSPNAEMSVNVSFQTRRQLIMIADFLTTGQLPSPERGHHDGKDGPPKKKIKGGSGPVRKYKHTSLKNRVNQEDTNTTTEVTVTKTETELSKQLSNHSVKSTKSMPVSMPMDDDNRNDEGDAVTDHLPSKPQLKQGNLSVEKLEIKKRSPVKKSSISRRITNTLLKTATGEGSTDVGTIPEHQSEDGNVEMTEEERQRMKESLYIDSETFNRVIIELLKLLKDSYTRFLQTEEYKQLKREFHMEEEVVTQNDMVEHTLLSTL